MEVFRRQSAQRLHRVGRDPNACSSYANERTFLAWVRTGPALVVAGLAVSAVPGLGVAAFLVGLLPPP